MVQILNYQQHFNLMKFIKNFILILLFIFPISSSYGAMVTHNQTVEVNMSSGGLVAGVAFNSDGTRMFTSYSQKNGEEWYIQEYNLSTLLVFCRKAILSLFSKTNVSIMLIDSCKSSESISR